MSAAGKEMLGFLSRRLPRRQFVENAAIAAGGIAAGRANGTSTRN